MGKTDSEGPATFTVEGPGRRLGPFTFWKAQSTAVYMAADTDERAVIVGPDGPVGHADPPTRS